MKNLIELLNKSGIPQNKYRTYTHYRYYPQEDEKYRDATNTIVRNTMAYAFHYQSEKKNDGTMQIFKVNTLKNESLYQVVTDWIERQKKNDTIKYEPIKTESIKDIKSKEKKSVVDSSKLSNIEGAKNIKKYNE